MKREASLHLQQVNLCCNCRLSPKVHDYGVLVDLWFVWFVCLPNPTSNPNPNPNPNASAQRVLNHCRNQRLLSGTV